MVTVLPDRQQPAGGEGHGKHREPTGAGAGNAVPVMDYTPASQVLTFLAGQISKTFSISLKNDTVLDGARTINSSSRIRPWAKTLGEPHEATITVGDNDLAGTFRFTSRDVHRHRGRQRERHREHHGDTVGRRGRQRSRSPGASRAAPRLTAIPPDTGMDVILPASGVLQFGPNEVSKTIQATIVPDDRRRAQRDADSRARHAHGGRVAGGLLGSPKIATLVIVDSDRKGTIQFSAPAGQRRRGERHRPRSP